MTAKVLFLCRGERGECSGIRKWSLLHNIVKYMRDFQITCFKWLKW